MLVMLTLTLLLLHSLLIGAWCLMLGACAESYCAYVGCFQ